MKTYTIVDPNRVPPVNSLDPHTAIDVKSIILEVEADFIYAQPSGVSTLHRLRDGVNKGKSDIVAVVPANLLILEV